MKGKHTVQKVNRRARELSSQYQRIYDPNHDIMQAQSSLNGSLAFAVDFTHLRFVSGCELTLIFSEGS
jgi:hypothetical protein